MASKFSFTNPAPQPTGAVPASAPSGGETATSKAAKAKPGPASPIPAQAPAKASKFSLSGGGTAGRPVQAVGKAGARARDPQAKVEPDFSSDSDFMDVPAIVRPEHGAGPGRYREPETVAVKPFVPPAREQRAERVGQEPVDQVAVGTVTPASETSPKAENVVDAPVAAPAPASSPESAPAAESGEPKSRFSFAAAAEQGASNPYEDGPAFDGFDDFDQAELGRASLDDDPFGVGIVQPVGVGMRTSAHPIAGIPEHAFEGHDPAVPPGSHYEAWVWNAMDKEGHITIELYVDAPAQPAGQPESLIERAYKPGYVRKEPKFDPNFHCLISVPDFPGAPWGSAKRVLLTPHTMRSLAKNAAKSKFNGGGGKPNFAQAEKPKAPEPQIEADPAGISAWLNGNLHHNVIFGRCTIAPNKKEAGDDYWMVLSKNDAQQIHREVYGDDSGPSLDPRQVFGMEGASTTQRVYDRSARRWENVQVPESERTPVPAAKRHFGCWSNADAARALHAAKSATGPMMPESWPAEDVAYVRSTHAAFRTARQMQEQATEIIAPLEDRGIEVPEDAPRTATEQSSIPAPRFARQRG